MIDNTVLVWEKAADELLEFIREKVSSEQTEEADDSEVLEWLSKQSEPLLIESLRDFYNLSPQNMNTIYYVLKKRLQDERDRRLEVWDDIIS